MKLLVAAITFAATLGMLFLIEAGKSPKEDSARIIEALKEEKSSAAVSTTPTPIKTSKQYPSSPQNGLPSQSNTPTPTRTQAPTLTPANPSPTSTPTPTPGPISSETPTPTFSSSPQTSEQGFINVTSLTSPIERGLTAQLNATTLPDARCSIKVTLPSGSQSGAAGLTVKTADASGNIAWSWKVGGSTKPGNATIQLDCSEGGQSFSKSLQMVITE